MTIVEFLLARIAEDEQVARGDESRAREWALGGGYPQTILSVGNVLLVAETFHDPDSVNWPGEHIVRHDPARVLAECESKRRIVEWHQAWPVLVEQPPTFGPVLDDEVASATLRMSQQIAWMTEQEYRNRFGSEPPTGPVLRLLALPYAGHPDYLEEWKP